LSTFPASTEGVNKNNTVLFFNPDIESYIWDEINY